MTRSVLVTGAFGYVGLAVSKHLAALGCRVVGLGHQPRNASAMALLPEAVVRVFAGTDEAERVVSSFGPFDAVVHLAGGGGPAKIAADPVAGIRNNVRATTMLAAAARAAGIPRLLFASTIAVYGTERDHGRPYAESDAALPDDIYGVVKEAAEQAWVHVAGGTCLRLSNIYGAGIGVDMGILGAVERFAKAAANGGEISLFGGGQQRIDYVHIDDVARGISLALEADSLPPHLNIGGGEPLRLCDMASLCVGIGTELGKPPTVIEKPAPPGKSWPDRSLDISLARKCLGFVPAVSYDSGLRGLIAMMREDDQ